MSRVDIDVFQDEMEIDKDTLKELYYVFIDEILDENRKIQELIKNGSIKDLKATVHNIKGVSGNYKAKKVYDKASKLNELLSNGENGDVELLINEIGDAIGEAVEEIEDFFRVK